MHCVCQVSAGGRVQQVGFEDLVGAVAAHGLHG